MSERGLGFGVFALFVQCLTIGAEFLDLGELDRLQLWIGGERLVKRA